MESAANMPKVVESLPLRRFWIWRAKKLEEVDSFFASLIVILRSFMAKKLFAPG